MSGKIDDIIGRLENLDAVGGDEIATVLVEAGDGTELFAAADRVRARFVGDSVHLRGIVEFSNYCVRNCLYCGLRRDNRGLERYRMAPGEIIEAARKGARAGIRTIVLQSGEDPFYSAEVLARIILRLKEELDVAVTVSVGDRTKKDYRILREAGADRYLLKHETADAALFATLRPGTTLEGRKKRLLWLKELGFQVGSGNMIGIPGQTPATIAADILFMRGLEVEMAGIGPFIPHGNTPLSGCGGGDMIMTLKTLALARLVMPWAHLPATTALATIHGEGRQKALKCGANVIMPDITPVRYKKMYEIYPGKAGRAEDGVRESLPYISDLIHQSGRSIAVDQGHGNTRSARLSRQKDSGQPER